MSGEQRASTSRTPSTASTRLAAAARSRSGPRARTRSPRSSRTGPSGMEGLRAYSVAGVRPDCDFFLWKITERYADLGELGAALNATPLAGWLETPYSYLATTKASQYTPGPPRAQDRPARPPLRRRLPVREDAAVVRAAARGASARDGRAHRDRRRLPDDPEPHDVLVRDRRPGVHDRLRVRGAVRLHAPDADAARERGEPLHRARHADLRRHGDGDPRRARPARRRRRRVEA